MTQKIKWKGYLSRASKFECSSRLSKTLQFHTYSLLDVVKKVPLWWSEVFFLRRLWDLLFLLSSYRGNGTLVIPTLANQIQQSTITLSCFFNMMLKGPHKGFFCHLAYSFTTTQIQLLCCYGFIKKNRSLTSCFLHTSSNPQKLQYTIPLS